MPGRIEHDGFRRHKNRRQCLQNHSYVPASKRQVWLWRETGRPEPLNVYRKGYVHGFYSAILFGRWFFGPTAPERLF